MKLSEFSVKKPILIVMAVTSVLLLGAISLTRLPLLFFPDMDWPSLRVQVSYTSSSPEEVERAITLPLEEALGTLSSVKRINSNSSSSGSWVSLEFNFGTDMDMMAVEVRDKIDQVRSELPEDVDQIRIRRWQMSDRPIFYFSVAWKGTQAELHHLVEKVIQPRIERIEGVANVDIRGMEKKQVLVKLDQNLLQAHGVDISALATEVRRNNLNLSGGEILDAGKKYTVRSIGEFQEVSEVAEMPLKGRGIVLSDVAQVAYDYPERKEFNRVDGVDAISAGVYKSSTANVVEVSRKVRGALDRIQSERGRDRLTLHIRFDQAQRILERLNTLKKTGISTQTVWFTVNVQSGVLLTSPSHLPILIGPLHLLLG